MPEFDDLDAAASAAVMDVFGGVEVVITPRSPGSGYTARPGDAERGPISLTGVFTEGTEHAQAMTGRNAVDTALSGAHAAVWLPASSAALLPYRPQRGDRVAVSGREWAVSRVAGTDIGDLLISLNEET